MSAAHIEVLPMTHPWWQNAVVYEIYPRSFQDSDGDGIGDLRGILRRVDYLAGLGVDAVWITPIYPSPMADFGYDVADYAAIHPLFGTLEDFDELLAALHENGIRLILDLVPNHSSIEHPWFQESRSSRNNPKRDWYLWRDPGPDGREPNNWVSIAGGKAWTFDEATGQYYCHFFLREQPDLNWRNPEVRAAIYDAMRFWLKRGIDGFRVDVFWLMIKNAQFRSDPLNPAFEEGQPDFRRVLPIMSADQPEIHEIAGEMRDVLAEFDAERVLIGEIYLPVEKLATYYGEAGPSGEGIGLHMPFNFNLMWQRWEPGAILAFIERYETSLPPHGWPSWVLGNHDQKRIASRVGAAQARVAMTLLLTLRGTPTLYNGDELGLENVPVPQGLGQDPFALAHPDQGRDPVRSPMPWTPDQPHAGFSTAAPWLPQGEQDATRSVAVQAAAPNSMLSYTKALLALRRAEAALTLGAWAPFPVEGEVLAYERAFEGRRLVILLNLASAAKEVIFRAPVGAQVLLASSDRDKGERIDGGTTLAGDEAVILALD
jgi:alpha-glucosidase